MNALPMTPELKAAIAATKTRAFNAEMRVVFRRAHIPHPKKRKQKPVSYTEMQAHK